MAGRRLFDRAVQEALKDRHGTQRRHPPTLAGSPLTAAMAGRPRLASSSRLCPRTRRRRGRESQEPVGGAAEKAEAGAALLPGPGSGSPDDKNSPPHKKPWVRSAGPATSMPCSSGIEGDNSKKNQATCEQVLAEWEADLARRRRDREFQETVGGAAEKAEAGAALLPPDDKNSPPHKNPWVRSAGASPATSAPCSSGIEDENSKKNQATCEQFLAEWEANLAVFEASKEWAAARGLPPPPPPWERESTPPPPTSTPPLSPVSRSTVLVSTVQEALEVFTAWDSNEKIQMLVSPSLPLAAAASIWKEVMNTNHQSLVINFSVLNEKASQAQYLQTMMDRAQSELSHFQHLLSLPWIPL